MARSFMFLVIDFNLSESECTSTVTEAAQRCTHVALVKGPEEVVLWIRIHRMATISRSDILMYIIFLVLELHHVSH